MTREQTHRQRRPRFDLVPHLCNIIICLLHNSGQIQSSWLRPKQRLIVFVRIHRRFPLLCEVNMEDACRSKHRNQRTLCMTREPTHRRRRPRGLRARHGFGVGVVAASAHAARVGCHRTTLRHDCTSTYRHSIRNKTSSCSLQTHDVYASFCSVDSDFVIHASGGVPRASPETCDCSLSLE